MLVIGTLKSQNGTSDPGSAQSAPCCTGRRHFPPLFSKAAFSNTLFSVTAPEHCIAISDIEHHTTSLNTIKRKTTISDNAYSVSKKLSFIFNLPKLSGDSLYGSLRRHAEMPRIRCTFYKIRVQEGRVENINLMQGNDHLQ